MGNQPSNGTGGGGVPPPHGSTSDDPRRQHPHHVGGAGGIRGPGGMSGGPGGIVHGGGYHSDLGGYGTAGGGGAYGGGANGGGINSDPYRMMNRSQSDASMTVLDADKTVAAVASSSPYQGADTAAENWLDDNTVPTVFRWEHGGRQVYITGTFNGWSRQIPMHRSGNDFTYIHNLKRGKHAFKFIVDDEWRFAPDQPTVADIEGRINNFIDVTDFKAYTGDREFEKEKAAAEYGYVGDDTATKDDGGITASAAGAGDQSDSASSMANRPDRDGEVFSHTMPDMDEYTKEPPPLPPHLRHIILNKPPQLQDTAALPVPQHVALNHLYCTAIKDNMMVLGITQRYKTKFVTTVYYSPCSSS